MPLVGDFTQGDEIEVDDDILDQIRKVPRRLSRPPIITLLSSKLLFASAMLQEISQKASTQRMGAQGCGVLHLVDHQLTSRVTKRGLTNSKPRLLRYKLR
ncbi:Uncharacterized protein HZ326_3291 [Fusarium oxysporum f. sp. albedinis]|nr:Uncharacterized protein HZ326_3291 [Fusarium oxysporum f. sp. albedinis]